MDNDTIATHPSKTLTAVLQRGANNFDLLRLIAAVFVIIGHSYAISPESPYKDGILSLLQFDYSGSLAVKFFFFLSGLLVTHSIIERPNPFHFLAKRAFRIFPGLFVCLCVAVFIVGPLFTKLSFSGYFSDHSTWTYISNNFFLSRSGMQWRLPGVFDKSQYGVNGSLWTLPFEVMCYIYIAIFYGLGLLKNKIVANVFFCGVVILSFVAHSYLPDFFSNPDSQLLPGCFAIGSLFAVNKNSIKISISGVVLLWLLVITLPIPALNHLFFYVALFYTAIYISSLNFVRDHLKLPFDASYGVYIYGFMVQQCLQVVFPQKGVHLHQIFAIAIALPLGILSWRFIEKRFIDLGHRLTKVDLTQFYRRDLFPELGAPKPRPILLWLSIVAVPVIIYVYFINWRTGAIYGDDLNHFLVHHDANGLAARLNLPLLSGKYRPMHGLSSHLAIEIAQKHIKAYYLFNVIVQAINTFVFAFILNLFLKSRLLSLLFGLLVGLSRFAFFNITQLMNGGLLEGLAMTFFLLSLYFLLKCLVAEGFTNRQRQNAIIGSIILANLSMYTHERYIIMLPFIVLSIFVFPAMRNFPIKGKLGLSLVAVSSVLLNIFLKLYVYNLSFLMGTAGAKIELSFPTVFSYLKQAVLSILQINKGDAYLIGTSYYDLPAFNKIFVIILVISFATIFIYFLINILKSWRAKPGVAKAQLSLFLLFLVLFGLFLIPAIITIRLEQRWLQASSAVFVLLLIMALSSLQYKNRKTRNALLCSFFFLFLLADRTYLSRGAQNIYLSSAKEISDNFKKAIDDGIIPPEITNLYLWNPRNDPSSEIGVNWTLQWGQFFKFYQGIPKKLTFIDSTSSRTTPPTLVNKDTDRVLYYKSGEIRDITDDYIRNPLTHFEKTSMLNLTDNNNLENLKINGFYNHENGFRWTNGDATIEFPNEYPVSDSVTVELNTFMPPACKDIHPRVLLIDQGDKEYQPVDSSRIGDRFVFRFFQPQPTNLKKIRLVAATFSTPPDQRILSFPFVSLTLKD